MELRKILNTLALFLIIGTITVDFWVIEAVVSGAITVGEELPIICVCLACIVVLIIAFVETLMGLLEKK